ncbi:MAG: carbohydrate binding domain-containing protein [Acidobacteriaceae bacterium]|nr:carbohydrate binding domain-containing protein [Acidobacteriaceae bacterium]
MRSQLVVAAFALLSGSFLASAANLVVNSGFETGDLSGWALSGTNSDPSDNGIYYGVDGADAHSGNYGAYFGPIGGILKLDQTLATSPGATYTISFWLAQSPATPAPYVNSFTASFGGATLYSQVGVPSSGFTQYSFSSTASSNSSILEFGFRNDTGYFSLDDASVTTSDTVVPEPVTSLLVVLPVGLFLLRRYKDGSGTSTSSLGE